MTDTTVVVTEGEAREPNWLWWVIVVIGLLIGVADAGTHLVLGSVIALLEIVAGIVIVAEPHIGYSTLAIITGIWLILSGLGVAAMGVAVHRAAQARG